MGDAKHRRWHQIGCLSAIVGLMTISAAQSAPSIAGASAHVRHGGTVSIGITSDPGTLDPMLSTNLTSMEIESQIFEPLLNLNSHGQAVPNLATGWTEPNVTTYIFHLRSGVTFQDGTPFDAAAVKFNLLRMASKTSVWSGFLPIKSVVATSSLTVTVTLSYPFTPFLSDLTFVPGYMASPAAVSKWGKDFGQHPVGTGAFLLQSWVHNEDLVLTANSYYWQKGLPYLSEVEYKFLPEPSVRSVDLSSGTIQVLPAIPPADVTQVKGKSQITYKTSIGTGVTFMAINAKQKPLTNPAVREAISLAVDRAAICKDVEFGLCSPARSMLSSAYWAYTAKNIPKIPYDPKKASALLKGKKYSFTLEAPSTYQLQAQAVKAELASIGINLTIREQTWTTLLNNYYKGDFSLQYQDDLPAPWPDPDGVLDGYYASKGPYNGTGYSSVAINSLLSRARQIGRQPGRKADYVDVQKLAQSENLYIPVYDVVNNAAWESDVHGIRLTADGFIEMAHVWTGS